MSDDLSTKARQVSVTLREWRVGTHVVTDEEGRETGEYIDEPKSFEQLMDERVQAADLLDQLTEAKEKAEALLDEIEASIRNCLANCNLLRIEPPEVVSNIAAILSKRENQKREGGTE